MASDAKQVENGKAFEYALLCNYAAYIKSLGLQVKILDDKAFQSAQKCYEAQSADNKIKYDESAMATIPTISKLEPGLLNAKGSDDILLASLASDSFGEDGDVRDVIFSRPCANWEIGFSAKNNNDAIKHSRLSDQIDFGKLWLATPCSKEYWYAISPIFDRLKNLKTKKIKWADVNDKLQAIYKPVLGAFRDEIFRINAIDDSTPAKLIQYLIGKYPFYKIIKEDKSNLVIVKAFNINKGLNKSVYGISSRYATPKLNLPSRIVEFEFKKDSDTTLHMILDGGWEISFRIHSASSIVESSLKFDIQLLGNPPILFTQHLFQD